MNERNDNGWESVGPHRDFEKQPPADDPIHDVSWDFDASFKHLMIGRPSVPVCIMALTWLVEQIVESSEVEVPDTDTCWRCLAIEDWATKEAAPVESAAIPW